MYTSSPALPLAPPVAKPEALNVISPTSESGANHSNIHSPDVVLELCWIKSPLTSRLLEFELSESSPATLFPA